LQRPGDASDQPRCSDEQQNERHNQQSTDQQRYGSACQVSRGLVDRIGLILVVFLNVVSSLERIRKIRGDCTFAKSLRIRNSLGAQEIEDLILIGQVFLPVRL